MVQFRPHIITRKQLTMAGSWGFEPRHTQAALKFLSRTRTQFPFEQLVSQTFPLEQAFEALQATAAWSTAKKSVPGAVATGFRRDEVSTGSGSDRVPSRRSQYRER